MSILTLYGLSLVTSFLIGGVYSISTEDNAPSHQYNSFMCSSIGLDATLGMQELEKAMAEDQWHNSDNYRWGTFSHSVMIGGVTIKKSHAIS